MGATRTYGIPRIIESSELFTFNNGVGKLRVKFTGGIPDPKFKIPATYSTADPFEQLVIESSPMFGKKIFRYGMKGQVIAASSTESIVADVEEDKKKVDGRTRKGRQNTDKDTTIADAKVYNDVETIGQATEVLLDLGVKADELGSPESVLAVMLREKVSFPNLKM